MANAMNRAVVSRALADVSASTKNEYIQKGMLQVAIGVAIAYIVVMGLFVLLRRRVERNLEAIFQPSEERGVDSLLPSTAVAPAEDSMLSSTEQTAYVATETVDEVVSCDDLSGVETTPPQESDSSLEERQGSRQDKCPIHRFTHHGRGVDLFAMRLFHLLLTILSVGVFSFWGKTRVRRYLCDQAEFLGDRFAFMGLGANCFGAG